MIVAAPAYTWPVLSLHNKFKAPPTISAVQSGTGMARDMTLLSTTPTIVRPASVAINHVQLRDLIICPRERGTVNYVQDRSIVELDLTAQHSNPRSIVHLKFTPNTLASLQLEGATLLAAGGQEAELHLSLHAPTIISPELEFPSRSPHSRSQMFWHRDHVLPGSINNSVTLTALSLTKANESRIEPRVVVSNNNCSVRFFDVAVRSSSHGLNEAGVLRLDVPVNHSSVSPDGRTLLSVGDSSEVYLHHLAGGSRITFTPISKLELPTCSTLSYGSTLPASFSTCFSSNGSKFAVASQEGMVVVWDVRSSKPFNVYESDRSRIPAGIGSGNGSASGWLHDDPWDWSRGGARAPGWGIRSVKFNQSTGHGREIMTFTEHTSLLHVVDARTFETEEVIRVPSTQPDSTSSSSLSPHLRSERQSSLVIRSSSLSPSMARSSSSPHPRMVVFNDASSDHSRAPLAIPTERRWLPRWRSSLSRYEDNTAGDVESVVVIPPFEDPEEEENVRTVLGQHGIRARSTREGEAVEVQEREGRNAEMEVDELDSDHEEVDADACVSSREPSRASSPVPNPSIYVPLPVQPLSRRSSESSDLLRVPSRTSRSEPYRRAVRTTTEGRLGRRARGNNQESDVQEEKDLDLAGVCFDPTGCWLYVASAHSVVEWSVKGAEKRWWSDSEWV